MCLMFYVRRERGLYKLRVVATNRHPPIDAVNHPKPRRGEIFLNAQDESDFDKPTQPKKGKCK